MGKWKDPGKFSGVPLLLGRVATIHLVVIGIYAKQLRTDSFVTVELHCKWV